MGNSVQKREKNRAFWLVNKQRHSRRANQIRAVDRTKQQRNKMAAAVGRFGENKKILIHVKFDRCKENTKYINQSTSNWTFGQHRWGLAKLLKATNRSRIFFRDSSYNEERLQLEDAYFSPYTYITERGQKHLIMRERKLKNSEAVSRFTKPGRQLRNVLTRIRKGKRLNTCLKVWHPLVLAV